MSDHSDEEQASLLPKQDSSSSATAQNKRTLFAQWAIAAIDGADGKTLTALFGALENTFGFGPAELGSLVFGQSIALALSAPIWALLADTSRNRVQLLSFGCALWGIWTALMAGATGFYSMLFLRILTGAALSSLTPISQSIVADIVEPASRGRHFGYIGGFSSMGSVVGGVLATSFGGLYFFGHSIAGWRLVLIGMALSSLLLAFFAPSLATDPRSSSSSVEVGPTVATAREGASLALSKAKKAFAIPTFLLIVLQGLFGLVPWNAMSFYTLWLQLIGLSDAASGAIVGCQAFGVCFGNVIGGILGDYAASRSPDTGRIRVAQTSVLLGTFLQPIILFVVPWHADYTLVWDAGYTLLFALLFFLQGLVCSWCLAGTNRPIFSELVPSANRASLLSWCLALEGVSAACFGAPVVGLLAERYFGYEPSRPGEPFARLNRLVRAANARALGSAMCWMTVVPWLVCFCIYSTIGWTYPRDRDRAREQGHEQ